MDFIEILKAIFIGIIEGITEWLPISSTGHMILADEFVRLEMSDEFKEMFFVVIQIGAILAVPTLFFDRLYPFSRSKTKEQRWDVMRLWFKVAVGVIPAAVIGLFLEGIIDKYLYTPTVIAIALIVYGIAFILIEYFKGKKGNEYRVNNLNELTYRDALVIGIFQILSFVPGTSRSGSTIIGGMLTGVNRVAAAEFSFFMAIPIVIGASGLKLLTFFMEGVKVSLTEVSVLLVGIVVSYIVSLVAIKFLMEFVKKHSFSAFGVYRIILGVIVLSYFLLI